MNTFKILCPCGCGENAEAYMGGFETTTVQVLPCATILAADPAVAMYSIRKSEGMRLASLAMAPAYRAPGGLLVFAS